MAQYRTIPQLSLLLGITERAARKAARAGQWRGHPLEVRIERGCRGAGGKRYLVRLGSLPVELQERARELWPELAAPTPALPAPVGAAPALPTSGKPTVKALRSDAGEARLMHGLNGLVTRDVLTRETALEIDQQMRRHVKGIWASQAGSTGAPQVARLATPELRELCRAAGVPEAEVSRLRVTGHFVSRPELRAFRHVNTARTDAKVHHDRAPYSRRDWLEIARPLDYLIGDGTALDVLVLRPDGSQWKIWLILWMDGRTGRLFCTTQARDKGKGITQAQVARSFACFCEVIGVPGAILVDNGSEYGWVDKLSRTVKVHKALPYNARAKPIEAAIRVLVNRHIALIEGFLGSDRLRKKSQSRGKPTTPYPGSIFELFAEIRRAIDAFNATSQRGRGNRGPNELWNEAVADGWRPRRAPIGTMTETLCNIETRIVEKGGYLNIKGTKYTSDALWNAKHIGTTVTVSIPSSSDDPPSVYDANGEFISLVYEEERFHPLDPTGAVESARKQRIYHRSAKEMERGAPRVDLGALQDAFLQESPQAIDPPAGEVVELTGERGKAVAARRRDAEARKQGLLADGRAEPPAPPALVVDDDPDTAADLAQRRHMMREMEAEDEARRLAEEQEEAGLRARAAAAFGGARSVAD